MPVFRLYVNFCKFTTQIHKFKRLFFLYNKETLYSLYKKWAKVIRSYYQVITRNINTPHEINPEYAWAESILLFCGICAVKLATGSNSNKTFLLLLDRLFYVKNVKLEWLYFKLDKVDIKR